MAGCQRFFIIIQIIVDLWNNCEADKMSEGLKKFGAVLFIKFFFGGNLSFVSLL